MKISGWPTDSRCTGAARPELWEFMPSRPLQSGPMTFGAGSPTSQLRLNVTRDDRNDFWVAWSQTDTSRLPDNTVGSATIDVNYDASKMAFQSSDTGVLAPQNGYRVTTVDVAESSQHFGGPALTVAVLPHSHRFRDMISARTGKCLAHCTSTGQLRERAPRSPSPTDHSQLVSSIVTRTKAAPTTLSSRSLRFNEGHHEAGIHLMLPPVRSGGNICPARGQSIGPRCICDSLRVGVEPDRAQGSELHEQSAQRRLGQLSSGPIWLTFETTTASVGILKPGESETATFTFNLDEKAPIGEVTDLNSMSCR